jgi:hypothetical protein
MTLRGLGGIIGYAAFGLIADAAGRRAVFFYNVGAIVFRALYVSWPRHIRFYPYLLPIFGYFVFGVFPVMRFICRSCFQLPTAGMRRFSVNIDTEIDGGPRRATEGVKASDDEALDAVLQAGRVEIQQQPDADMARAQVGQNLRFVCRDEGRDTFDFKYNGILDHNIGPEPE